MIYRTEYMQRLKAFKDNKIIKVVTGLRRFCKINFAGNVSQ